MFDSASAAPSKPSILGQSSAAPGRSSGGAFADSAQSGRGAWAGQGEDSGDSGLRIERHEVSFDPPAAAEPREAAHAGGFTGSMGTPVHSAPALSSDNRETEESRNTGVAARLRKWLKRDDASDGAAGPTTFSSPQAPGAPAGTSDHFTGSGMPPTGSESSATAPQSSSPGSQFAATGSAGAWERRAGEGAPAQHDAGGEMPSAPPIGAGPELRTAIARAFDAPRTVEPARSESHGRGDHGLSVSDRSSERMSDRREELRASDEVSPSRARDLTGSSAAREITVPIELTPADLESGVVIRFAVRLQESQEDDSDRRRAA